MTDNILPFDLTDIETEDTAPVAEAMPEAAKPSAVATVPQVVSIASPDMAISAYKMAASVIPSATNADLAALISTAERIGKPKTQAEADELGITSVQIGSAVKRLTEFWKAPKAAFKAMHTMMCNAEKETLEPWTVLDSSVKQATLAYVQEQRRIAEEAQRKREQALMAEQKRLADEAAKKARVGDIEAAQELQQRATTIAAAPVAPAVSIKVTGMTTTARWVGVVTDPMAVVKAIAAGTIPIEVIKEWDQSFINKQAAALKNELHWPGVAVSEEEGTKRTGR